MRNWIVVVAMLLVPSVASAEYRLQIRNVVTDLGGNEITSIAVGQQYKLQTIVTDIRNPAPVNPTHRGVNSAGAKISYDPMLSSIDENQTVEFGSFFNLIQEAQLQPGLIQGYAGSFNPTGPGNAPQFLFSVVLTAEALGLQVFTPSMPTLLDAELGIYTDNPPVPAEAVEFVGASLEIVPEPSTYVLSAVAVAGLLVLKRRRRNRVW